MVTCLGFKANQIVQGDTEGVLNMWDLKARSSRNVPTNRGPIRYLRFAPGKQNLKLLILYNDGIDIIDLKQVILSIYLRFWFLSLFKNVHRLMN